MKHLVIAILLLAIACAPPPVGNFTVVPTSTIEKPAETLNDNPSLALGVCHKRIFYTPTWGEEHIVQCVPDGYTLHEEIEGSPIRVNHTGAVYSIRPLATSGQIGFALPSMTLLPGEYLVQVSGFAHFWGSPEHYAIRGHYSIRGIPGMVDLGGMPLVANGDYLATMTLAIEQAGVYDVSVYLLMVHATQTADSFLTIKSIEVFSD